MYDRPTPRCRLVVERSISFAQPSGVDLKVDVWRPDDSQTRPAILLIIGGSWRNALRSNFDALAGVLASWGYVVANTTYRSTPEHVWPTQLQDVKTCVRWMRANAHVFGIATDRVATVGGSAGGHLAAMLAVTTGYPPFEGEGDNDQPSDVQAAVCLCAPTDMRDLQRFMANKDTPRHLLGGSPEEVPDAYAEASPITWIAADAAPTLFIHGEEDPIVPIASTRHASEELAKLGAESHFIALPRVEHGVHTALLLGSDPAPMQAMQDFLARHLQPPAV